MGNHSNHGHHGHHGHRFPGSAEALRSPQRMALLEVSRVVDLCLEGVSVDAVLDVGTGSGVFAEEFVRRGLKLTGIDVNPDMIAAARQYVPSAQFQEAPADAQPFDAGAFDLVFLGHVLHEVPDPVRALSEARRVAQSRVVVLEWPYRAEEFGPPLEHRLPDEAVVRFAGEAGLQHHEQVSLTHMVLHRFSV
ncbi:MAG: class I SAM-dependent methyltransferase [Nitrososphaerota archaeon]